MDSCSGFALFTFAAEAVVLLFSSRRVEGGVRRGLYLNWRPPFNRTSAWKDAGGGGGGVEQSQGDNTFMRVGGMLLGGGSGGAGGGFH